MGDRVRLAMVEADLNVLYLQLDNAAQAETHMRRSAALFDERGLEMAKAQAVHKVLRMGLARGWNAVRQLLQVLRQDGEPP